jgi:uncharacterized protein (TIGR03089 family)
VSTSPAPAGPPQLLDAALRRDPARPLITFYDDATDERTELSVTTFANWVAKTANLLRDDVGAAPGDRVAVLLPAHWQTAAVLLGAWSMGLTVAVRPWATAGLPAGATDIGSPLQAVFVSGNRLSSWLEDVPDARHRFVLGLRPDGEPLDEIPEGYLDYLAEVRRYPDIPPDPRARSHTEPATPDGTSFQEWMDLARDLARTMGLRSGDRLLVDADTNEQPVKWLLAPLAVGASVVLCAGLDKEAVDPRAAAAGATHVM